MTPFLLEADVFVENDPVATNISYRDVTGYLPVEPDNTDYEFEVELNASGDEVFDTDAPLEQGMDYTIVLAARLSERNQVAFEPVLLRDDYERPDRDSAAVRIVHVSPDTPALDVTLAGANRTLADNVTFRDGAAYVTIPEGRSTLELRPATPGDDGPVVTRFTVSFDGGDAYSVFLAGFARPSEAPVSEPLSPIVFRDSDG
jgi:hypothetical protein